MEGVSSIIATNMMNIKKQYQANTGWTVSTDDGKIPLFHGLEFERSSQRYYPYGDFMSNILGFVDANDK